MEQVDPWGIQIGPSSIVGEGRAWRVTARGMPSSLGLAGPRLHADEEIRVDLEFRPNLNSPTLERAYLPDDRPRRVADEAPGFESDVLPIDTDSDEDAASVVQVERESGEGAESDVQRPAGRHHWLLACPSASVTGRIVLTSGDKERVIELDGAPGYHDHVWGTDLLGYRFHRRYATRLSWPDGAIVCEFPTHSKFVQVAATFMLFEPGAPPRVLRGDRVRMAGRQLSTWLLSHPGEMRWRQTNGATTLRQETICPVESTATTVRALVTAELSYRPSTTASPGIAAPSAGMRTVSGIGMTEMDQVARLDMPVLNRLLERCLFASPGVPTATGDRLHDV